MPHAKFLDHMTKNGFWRRKFLKDLAIYGHGGHVTKTSFQGGLFSWSELAEF